ncbi:hypothetical protein QTI33_25715 [Variovorax sp. J22P271]|uniref:hypothetical protein n=1 Tax=Variovorax davisae TaxID=3053515 RepID=UPI002574F630|nr:hypothetical protein [Variovorax sp. J22P271]MDM0035556.1 hypothetical protein [Variovorax sp. J22P271]
MHRLRLFALWIVMLAVPFQGYAAVAMVFCGPVSSGAMAAVATQAAGAHDHAAHHHGDGHDDAQHAAHGSTDKGSSGAQPDGMHKCGTCGACHACALIGSLPLAVFHDLPAAGLAEPAIAWTAVVPHVLDKPPRA